MDTKKKMFGNNLVRSFVRTLVIIKILFVIYDKLKFKFNVVIKHFLNVLHTRKEIFNYLYSQNLKLKNLERNEMLD
jgi:hypothetical protein